MKKVYLVLSIVLIAYIIARAINVAFTHDEAATFVYQKYSIAEILLNSPTTANNHILNTLLAKFCAFFSVHQFSLRLPNVLASLLYLYSVYKISALITRDQMLRLCFFLAMFANVALLEFFALCRGYGMGISLMLFSVYQLLLMYKADTSSSRPMHLSLGSAVLAVFANFALVNPVFVIFLLVLLRHYQTNDRKLLNALQLPVLYGLLLLALCAYPAWRLIAAEELYYGGDLNFVKDTLFTMLDDMTRGWARQPEYYTKFLIFLSGLIVASIGVPLFYIRRNGQSSRLLLIGPALLASCILLINAQFYLMGTKLVVYRTALYLFPLIVLAAFSAVDLVKIPAWIKRSGAAFVTSLFLFALLHNAGIKSTREWWFDAYNKDVIAYVLQHKPENARKTRIFSYWLMSNSLDYYVETRYSKYLERVPYIKEPLNAVGIDSYDFVYVRSEDGMGEFTNFQLVQSYNEGNFLLYQKKR